MLEICFNKERLKEMRKENDFTQEELAEKSGLSDRYIRKLESGRSNPAATVLYSISNALNASMEEFIIIREVADEEL